MIPYCAPGGSQTDCTLIRNPNRPILNAPTNPTNDVILNIATDITFSNNGGPLISDNITQQNAGTFFININQGVTLNNTARNAMIINPWNGNNRNNQNTLITNNGTLLRQANSGPNAMVTIYGNSALINGPTGVIDDLANVGANGTAVYFNGSSRAGVNAGGVNNGIGLHNMGIINGVVRVGSGASVPIILNSGYIRHIAADDGTFETINNSGTINSIAFINGTINTINNSGNIGTLDIIQNKTITSLANSGAINTITNNGTISNLNNSDGYIYTLNHNAINTITLTSNTNSVISHLTNAGTIDTQGTPLTITGVNNTDGSFTNNGTINATNARVSIWGGFTNNGTINAQTLALGSSNPMPSATTTAHIGGTINNGAGGGSTHLILNNFAVELTQMANDYNTLQNLSNNTMGHIIIGNNANIDSVSAGLGADIRGIMIVANTDKWYQAYDYDALFVKNNVATGDTIASGITAANLYSPQSTVQIYDTINPTNNKRAFQLNIQAKDSPAQTLSSTLLNGIISKNVLVGNFIDSMSRRTFWHSLHNYKGETFVVKSKSVNKEGKRIKDDDDLLVPLTYDNIDILHETDMIFAPHAKDTNRQTFFLPITRYTRTHLSDNYTGTEYAGGFIGGRFFNLSAIGSLGVYGGYEYGQSTLPRKTGAAYVKNHSFLFGAHYYKAFYTHKTSEYYMKFSLHSQIQVPHFELALHTINTNAKQNLFAFGADIEYKLGINFYNIFNNSYISPEIGLGYGFLRINAFNLDYHSNYAVNEYYPSHFFHLPSTSLQVKYLKAFERNLRASFLLGARYIINNTQETSLQIGQLTASSVFSIPSFFGIGGVGILYTLGDNKEISAQIDTAISKEQMSAALSFRYSLWF